LRRCTLKRGLFAAKLALLLAVSAGLAGAQSFGPVVNLSNTSKNCSISCHGTQHNSDVVGNTVHVLWAENNRTDYYSGGSVVYRRSLDFGTTWAAIQILMTVTDPPSDTIGVGPDHTSLCANGSYVHAIWDIDSEIIHVVNDTDTTYEDHYWIYYSRSTDAGVNWSAPVLLDQDTTCYAPAIAASGNYVYAIWLDDQDDDGWANISLRRSTDNGASWGSESSIWECGSGSMVVLWPDIAASGSYVHVIAVDWQALQINKLYLRSTNNGVNWTNSTLFTSTDVLVSFYGYPTIDAATSNYVYAAWDDGYYIRVRRSTDNGANWQSVQTIDSTVPSPGGWAVSPSIACDPTGAYVHLFWWLRNSSFNGEIVYQYSANYGATWSPRVNASNNTRYWSILPSAAARDTCACVTWSDMDFLITDADMFYRYTCISALGSDEAEDLSKLSLIAVPHRGRVEIAFNLPETGEISLCLYSLDGRKSADVASGEFSAGTHTATMQTGGMASGIYMLVLSATGGQKTARVVVLGD